MGDMDGAATLGLFLASLCIQVFYYFVGHYRAQAVATMREAMQEPDPRRFVELINKMIGFQIFYGIHVLYAMRRDNPFRVLNQKANVDPIDYDACYGFWQTFMFPNMLNSYEKIRSKFATQGTFAVIVPIMFFVVFMCTESYGLAIKIIASAAFTIMFLVNVYDMYRGLKSHDENEELLVDLDTRFASLIAETRASDEVQ